MVYKLSARYRVRSCNTVRVIRVYERLTKVRNLLSGFQFAKRMTVGALPLPSDIRRCRELSIVSMEHDSHRGSQHTPPRQQFFHDLIFLHRKRNSNGDKIVGNVN